MCALIARSRAMDPRRTASMIDGEKKAWQYFEELKLTLPTLSPRWWKRDFKSYVDKFIGECLDKKSIISAIPGEGEDEEELDRVHLHAIKRLVAGAVQEWELVQQPKYASACAKIDGALVWQGRRYVNPTMHATSCLNQFLQS